SLRGFGFVAIGSGLTDFHRPATETQKVINTLIKDTDRELGAISEETYSAIGKNLWETAMGLSVSTGVMAVLVILIAIWMASAFTRSITQLIQGISRFRSGERNFRFNAPIKDEIGALADSFDEMADSIVESVKGPLSIISLDRNILYMNEEALQLIDGKLEDIQGRPYSESTIFPTGSIYCPITALTQGVDAQALYHEPSSHYYKGKASFLTNKQGENIGYVITTTDVTNLIEDQKSIEQQRALLSTVFASSPDLIWYEDDQGYFLAANPRYASLMNADPDDMRGKRLEDLLPPDVAENMRVNDNIAIDGAIPLYTEERLRFADGHEEILDVVRTPLYSPMGEYIGLLGVARDVSQRVFVESELRRTQQELKTAAAAANKASESKSSFLARMSHEIRTPMNAIIGMTNITKRKLSDGATDSDELLSHVRQIEVSAAHLLGLLNDILDISKIEAGKIELSEESFDLTRLAANVEAIIRPRCQEKGITFEVLIEGLEVNTFISDPLRLRQVLINLLGNAVKFTPELGTVTFRIRQEASAEGKKEISFHVIDTGIGIAKEALAVLFTPFEQGGGHISRHYGGTGLGLSISKSIVMLMGGDIEVRSTEGKGSEFSFCLWLKEDHSAVVSEIRVDDVSMLPGKRVLLVDDVDVNRIIVTEQLAQTGLVIDEASDGCEALEKFQASPVGYYDIILMDVQMPKMDGHEASRAIRELPRTDAAIVPIVAMTANAFKEDVDLALANGMNSHIAKPLETERLMEVLLSFLGAPSGLS
ncbi:PAS domain-containing protein, partial [Desulfovibrio sp. OttesenSCG-928-M14]|nr:PAS domain-containing protein [Desulfovibrio sp. OttesenSCG-928-M14]